MVCLVRLPLKLSPFSREVVASMTMGLWVLTPGKLWRATCLGMAIRCILEIEKQSRSRLVLLCTNSTTTRPLEVRIPQLPSIQLTHNYPVHEINASKLNCSAKHWPFGQCFQSIVICYFRRNSLMVMETEFPRAVLVATITENGQRLHL